MAFGWRTSRPEGAAVIDARSANAKRTFCSEDKTMKLRDQATNAQNTRPSRFRSDVPEERGKNVPTLDEVRRRVLEIHIEHGDHSYDLDEYLDEWLQAERELQEKYNKSSR
jgi:hypothetical protein